MCTHIEMDMGLLRKRDKLFRNRCSSFKCLNWMHKISISLFCGEYSMRKNADKRRKIIKTNEQQEMDFNEFSFSCWISSIILAFIFCRHFAYSFSCICRRRIMPKIMRKDDFHCTSSGEFVFRFEWLWLYPMCYQVDVNVCVCLLSFVIFSIPLAFRVAALLLKLPEDKPELK